MNRTDEVYLIDILRSIEKIERYIAGQSYEQFVEDEESCDSVTKNIEVVGEAIKNLSQEFKTGSPHIAWADIVGMRNKLIHHYWGTDLDIVWKVATEDFPRLRIEIRRLLDTMNPEP